MSEIDEARAFEEHALRELRSTGYRITMPRIQVIRALADTPHALSAYQIHEKIVANGGRIDVVSVYRILSTLQDVGLIHHVGVANGYFPCRSAGCQGKRTMVLVCDDTNEVQELAVPKDAIDEIEALVSAAGFIPASIKIEITGTPKVPRG